MLRLTLLLLCLILTGAAAGRYKAEAAVRETRGELRRLDSAKASELLKIQVLRAEVAFLESPERLSMIAEEMTDLEPLSGAQLLTAQDFQVAFGAAAGATAGSGGADKPVAIAQADSSALR